MAFVRRKKMGGHYYFQLVRNYRDGGRHRQKVLCHLGIYDSIEGAVEGAKEKVAFHEEAATSSQNAADRVKAELADEYYEDVETYSEEEARDERDRWRWWDPSRALDYYVRVYGEGEWHRAVEEWEIAMQIAELRVEYYDKVREAALNRMRARRCRARLNKLLECQQKYGS